MSSLCFYDNLRKEFRHVLLGDEISVDEDVYLMKLLSFSKDSVSVLRIVRNLKEEGNSFFKGGNIDDALEKYSYAGVVLVQFEFKKEEEKREFVDLAICILLNYTACLGRKNEFVQVGQLCSIILDYSPNNIKALFRRAMAAVKLGKFEWAYWDLVWAADIDPKNSEVIKELEKVKLACSKSELIDSNSNIPIGLGLDLSSTMKKEKVHLGRECATTNDLQNIESCSARKRFCNEAVEAGRMEKNDGQAAANVKDTGGKECENPKEANTLKEMKEEVKEEKKIEEVINDEKMEEAVIDSNLQHSNLTEPKYRFVNRHRSGSTLAISKKEYELLIKGKSIHYFNSRVSSPMTIRAVLGSTDAHKKESKQENKEFDDPFTQNRVPKGDTREVSSQQKEIAAKEVAAKESMQVDSKKRKVEDERNSYVPNITINNHSPIKSRNAERKKGTMRQIGRSKKVDLKTRTASKKIKHELSVFSKPTFNFDCGCRFQARKKRRLSTPPSILMHHSWKKYLFYPTCSVELCISSSNNKYCIILW